VVVGAEQQFVAMGEPKRRPRARRDVVTTVPASVVGTGFHPHVNVDSGSLMEAGGA